MTTLNVSYLMRPAIQVNRWIRNGLVVDAGLQSGVTLAANQIARWRCKELFRWHGAMGFTPAGADALINSSGAGERQRWRFAFHTGPTTKEIAVRFLCCVQNFVGVSGGSGDPYSRLRILTTGGATVGDGNFHFGAGALSVDTPNNFATGNATIAVSPDTDYTAVISDFDTARIVAATVYERSLEPDTANGYVPMNFAAQMPIYDDDRSSPMLLAADLWKRAGAQLLNWSADDQSAPMVNSTVTYTNLVDGTSTAVSSSTPGYTLDLTYCNRLSQIASGVPCVLKVWGVSGASPGDGTVALKSSSGTIVGSVTGFTTTPGWFSTTLNLPAASDKYDLQFKSNTAGINFSVYAVSLYQYE